MHGTFSKIITLELSLNKYKNKRNHPLYLIRSQWNKTRNQQQKKLYEYLEMEKYSLDKQWATEETKEEIENSSNQIKIKI